MFEFLQSTDFWIAVAAGGALVKAIDYLFPAILNRRENNEEFFTSEKSNLRRDIEYLRQQIKELREEVGELKAQMDVKDREISKWQRLYWRKKLELDKVVWEVRHYAKSETVERVLETISDETKKDAEPSP